MSIITLRQTIVITQALITMKVAVIIIVTRWGSMETKIQQNIPTKTIVIIIIIIPAPITIMGR
jgi:hypothetical protein